MGKIDCLFINPGSPYGVYQELTNGYTTIEPPTWALLLAQSCRSKGFDVAILDVNAEALTEEEAIRRIERYNPKFICFVVYGQNVNAGTVGMAGATKLSKAIAESNITAPVGYIGSYMQALPKKVLDDEDSIDFIFTNEGVYALHNLLATGKYWEIKGVAYKDRKLSKVKFNDPEIIVPQFRMDIDLPGYAWDLLPDLSLYRSPMWHANYSQKNRSPYVAIQTSLGCPMKCSFCMINNINRDNNNVIGVASDYSKIRYWSPDFIIKEFDKLAELGVKTIKITDELHLFNKNYYAPLHNMLAERDYGKLFNLWAYSRVDTVANPELLVNAKKAGINWLALGIESANRNVRLETSKGKFQDVDITKVVEQIHGAGIEVMANYIFGLPSDTLETMKETSRLARELCTAGYNAYAAMALPGSKLYFEALLKKERLPKSYLEYSFHSYETVCLSTPALSAAEILKFRDDDYIEYHSEQKYLNRIRDRFGKDAVQNVKKMTEVRLKRKIIEEAGLY